MTLKDIKIGSDCRVLTVGGEKVLRRRLLEMGITPGTVIKVKKAAPMGDPIELLLRGYVLTLRLEDAERITVEEVGTDCPSDCAGCSEKCNPRLPVKTKARLNPQHR